MMSRDIDNLRKSAVVAGRSALATSAGVLVLIVLRATLDGRFSGSQQFNWYSTFRIAGFFGVVWFCIFFVSGVFRTQSRAPAKEILDNVSSDDSTPKVDLSGFVAMEYFGLMLNRTFVVFVAPEGLYGWKAVGVVPAGAPTYFQPYAKMLADPKLMRDVAAVRKLANLKGGFFIRRSEISSVEVIPKQKSGMAGIPHSGRILVRFASGRKREFILLGIVDAERIRQSILS
jgi:hypothetical protein